MSLTKKLERKRRLKEAKDEADRLVAQSYDEFFIEVETVFLYGLRKATELSGDPFGATRLKRAYWTMIEEYKRMMNKFQYGKDDSHYFAMQQELKAIGIDVAELQAEAERRYPNGVQRETKRWGEE